MARYRVMVHLVATMPVRRPSTTVQVAIHMHLAQYQLLASYRVQVVSLARWLALGGVEALRYPLGHSAPDSGVLLHTFVVPRQHTRVADVQTQACS